MPFYRWRGEKPPAAAWVSEKLIKCDNNLFRLLFTSGKPVYFLLSQKRISIPQKKFTFHIGISLVGFIGYED
jgi:hypothetical protein